MGNMLRNGVQRLFLGLIWIYRHCLSPLKPRTCRFYPTCSEYARQAVIKYGPWQGLVLTWKRLRKCHPWHPGGYDPLN
ncbi:MAG: membrane protein insertion efficiency factor YidD [Limnochordia bacterium]